MRDLFELAIGSSLVYVGIRVFAGPSFTSPSLILGAKGAVIVLLLAILAVLAANEHRAG